MGQSKDRAFQRVYQANLTRTVAGVLVTATAWLDLVVRPVPWGSSPSAVLVEFDAEGGMIVQESNLRDLAGRVIAETASGAEVAAFKLRMSTSSDVAILSRAASAPGFSVREIAIKRLIEVEPGDLEHRLRLHQHFLSTQRISLAENALDDAERVDPNSERVLRARLALHGQDRPAELLALAKQYLPRFGSDPILNMVIVRCEKALAPAPRQEEADLVLPRPHQPAISSPLVSEKPVVLSAAPPVERLKPPRPDISRIVEVLSRVPQQLKVKKEKAPMRRIVFPAEGPGTSS